MSANQSAQIQNKLLPQALDLEEDVIGAMMIDSRAIDDVVPIIKTPDVFYKQEHKLIYTAILELVKENEPVDLSTVSFKLRTLGKLDKVGGDFALIGLIQKVASGAHSEYHARILIQQWVKRSLIAFNAKLMNKAYDDTSDIFDLIEEQEKALDAINQMINSGSKQISYAEALNRVVHRVEQLTSTEHRKMTGVPTGFKKIDVFTGGWQATDLIIIAARPSMGKTALMVRCIDACAKQGLGVGVISLEMSTMQLATRNVAVEDSSNFHLRHLMRDGFRDKQGNVELNSDQYFLKLLNLVDKMKDYPVYVNDNSGLTIHEVILQARMWKRQHDIKLLVIDYLQLMSADTKGGNREQEISIISRKLKQLAKELDIPVIALSQLSRAVETRGGVKRPMLSDLRESGAIEQDADIVTFLYRPAYYGYDVDNPSSLTEQQYNEFKHLIDIGANTELIFGKYREGSLAIKGLCFDANKTKFYDPDDKYSEVSVSNDEVDF